MHRPHRFVLFILIFFIALPSPSNAWIYPEHRAIALLAISRLSPQQRAQLEKCWAEARRGHENRLTSSSIVPDQGRRPTQIDYAAWAAIGGDHSCSPHEMLKTILESEWILNVADVAARLQSDIQRARNRSMRINALRNSDLRLQRVDDEYATRAGSNNVHFLLARPQVDTETRQYLDSCMAAGAPLNALGAYAWFHRSAMYKASRYAKGGMTPEESSAAILSALADEAFAIHFLEDVYAAGHTAGTWGPTSVRKGTHDFYNERGLEVVTWDGKRVISLGDAFMREEDAHLAAENVTVSLAQLLKAASGEWRLDYDDDIPSSIHEADTFNVCKNNFQILRTKTGVLDGGLTDIDFLPEVLMKTPVPGLADGLGEIPRFRSELGKFFGVSSSLNATSLPGGFGTNQNTPGWVGGIESGLRFGFGLDGVLNQSGDGLVYVQAGYRLDASSSQRFDGSKPAIPGIVPAAIPGRSAFSFRMRLPFWILPGDLLVAGPILALVSPKTLTHIAAEASNGGVIPWQSGFATSIGRFQLVAGREFAMYHYGSKENGIFVPVDNTNAVLLSYTSTKFEFPLLEYRPFRTFSMDQTSSGMIQVSLGVDVPHGTTVILPLGAAMPELRPVWSIGVRAIFDWRHYF